METETTQTSPRPNDDDSGAGPESGDVVDDQTMTFRLLCRRSTGKKSKEIKGLSDLTGCTFLVEDPIEKCPEQVISVTGHAIFGSFNAMSDRVSGSAECFLSTAQEGLLTVYEMVLELEGNSEGSTVCRLLCPSLQEIKTEETESIVTKTGTEIVIVNKEDHPACAGNDDQLIQITGGIAAVKKALMLVSERLQQRFLENRAEISSSSETAAAAASSSAPTFSVYRFS